MSNTQAPLTLAFEAEDWHPRYWTLAFVSTVHVILAATFLTITPPPPALPVLESVEIVTLPDGTTPPQNLPMPSDPVTLTPVKPKPILDPRFGPRPTDTRRQSDPEPAPRLPEPPDPTPPAPTLPVPRATPQPAPKAPAPPPLPLPPTPERSPEPVPLSKPTPTPVPATPSPSQKSAPASPAPSPTPEPVQPAAPSLVIPELSAPERVDIQPKANQDPVLAPRASQPVAIRGQKLKDVNAPNLSASKLPSALPIPAATPDPAPAIPAARPPASPPPVVNIAPPRPLTPSQGARPLPKVQVPRVNASDIRLPEVQEAPSGPPAAAARPSQPSAGVTSLAPGGGSGPARGGGSGGSPPSGGGGGGGGAQSGAQGGNQSGSPSGGGGTIGGGGTGALPRRPGGATVREAFPRGDGGTLLGKMDKSYDCSRLNRERDERCPNWDPIEGRNSRATGSIEAPVPRGVTPPRYAPGTNPLPVCPPGTPGSQFGLSCLPSRDGPGIPKQ